MKKLLLTPMLMLTAVATMAQTDITKYYLSNYGFDENFDYTAASSQTVAEEIKEVKGWTAELSANYTIVGTYEFGFGGVYNTASVPAVGYDNEAGGGLAISTGWDQTFVFYQTVILPAGTYTVNVPTYNGSNKTAAISQVAWVPNGGSPVKSKVTSYPIGQWTLDQITFTLTKTTEGRIQFGMQATSGGSANSAKLMVDYVQLLGQDMTADKSVLKTVLDTAAQYYGEGSGNEAATLKAAIDHAQGVYDNAAADMPTILDEKLTLENAIMAYRMLNASEENPVDKTEYILNPSFEDAFKNWATDGLQLQSNNSFTKKAGVTYAEKWVEKGNNVGNAYAKQAIAGLPKGQYKLTVAAQNYLQDSNKKNTGAYIYADDQRTDVYTPADYSVKFTNITGEVEIGFVAEGATGNWLAIDNFRLDQIGYVSAEEMAAEVQRMVGVATSLQGSMMTDAAKAALQSAVELGTPITAESAEADMVEAAKALKPAISAAQMSIADYEALANQIATVSASYNENLNEAAAFKAELDEAQALYGNGEATPADLTAEIEALDKALFAFRLANATPGTGTAPRVTKTVHYVATGATQALMRSTVTGSNILEKGVCWSTEHEPTVLDNRTTKNFNIKGDLYHVTGMQPATVYYLRPYVINKTYTVAYGDEVKIVTHPKGTCTGSWNEGAPDEAANKRCRDAIQQTISYFNEWTGIMGFHLTGNYGAATPTADCSYGGWMRIGPNAGNQAIGTVLHETGHGVGVGTSDRWWDTTVHNGAWLGREANDVLRFLENCESNDLYFYGDRMHGWATTVTGTTATNASSSFDWLVNGADKDKHMEVQYIGGMCILHGLFIDGLNPTTAYTNGISGYTYNFDDTKKYYLMNKSEAGGLGQGVLYQRSRTGLGWQPNLTDEAMNDSAAWYIEFQPTSGYYYFKNAATGTYLSHSSTAMSAKSVRNASSTERFQLMPDRTDVTIGTGSQKITTHGYWFTWNDNGDKAMCANALGRGYGSITMESFNFSDAATKQQWIIISEDELEAYQAVAVATGVAKIAVDDATLDGKRTVVGIYTTGGVQLQETQKGFNIIKYSDGTTRKIYVK